jgi:hypothetical protein
MYEKTFEIRSGSGYHERPPNPMNLNTKQRLIRRGSGHPVSEDLDMMTKRG